MASKIDPLNKDILIKGSSKDTFPYREAEPKPEYLRRSGKESSYYDESLRAFVGKKASKKAESLSIPATLPDLGHLQASTSLNLISEIHNYLVKQSEDVKSLKTDINRLNKKIDYIMENQRSPSEEKVGIEFESKEDIEGAFNRLFDEKLPFEIVGHNILIVPRYVKENLQRCGFTLTDVEIVDMAYLPPKESRKIKQEFRELAYKKRTSSTPKRSS